MSVITRFPLEKDSNICILVGEGDPNGTIRAQTGSTWHDRLTGDIYKKTAASATSWQNVGTGSVATTVEESSGPDQLDFGAVADGEYLRRSGSTIIGDTPSGGGAVTINGPTTPPQPSYAQGNIAAGVTSVVFGAPVASGSLLVVIIGSENSLAAASLSDTRGTTYSLIVSDTSTANKVAMYAGLAPSAGANTVTVTGITNSFGAIQCYELPGYSATANVTGNAVRTASPAALSITPTVNNCVIICSIRSYATSGSITPLAPAQLLRFLIVGSATDGAATAVTFQQTAAALSTSFVVVNGLTYVPIIAAAFPVTSSNGNDGEFHYYANNGRMYGPRYAGLWGLPPGTLALP